MPPKGKLPAAVIADLEAWVKTRRARPARRRRPARRPPTPGRRCCAAARLVEPAAGPRARRAGAKDGAWSDDPSIASSWPQLEASGLTPAGPADPRTLAPPPEPGADRAAADARAGRAFVAECERGRGGPAGRRREAGRLAARVAPLRRALGAALDGRGPVHRDARQRVELRGPSRLALSRLPDPRLQRRRALRPVRPRAHRRRPAAGAALERDGAVQRVGHRHRVLPLRRSEPRRLHQPPADRLRPGRQPDRHADQGVPGDDRRLRPLPRPQARRRLDARLLRAARHPPQLADGQPLHRRAGGERRRPADACAS